MTAMHYLTHVFCSADHNNNKHNKYNHHHGIHFNSNYSHQDNYNNY